jgi:Uma2 family endonuclease
MTTFAEASAESGAHVLCLPRSMTLSDDQFFDFCQVNRDLRIERTAAREIVIMSPTGWETGSRNAEIIAQLRTWARADGTGVSVDSSTGFKLPNGAIREPDAAWVRKTRLSSVPPDQKQRFLPLAPDFAIELRSPSDQLAVLQSKMVEYVENGVQLGWLLDPEIRSVYVYRPHAQVEELKNVSSVAADPEAPGFTLDLKLVWEPEI